MNIKCTTYFDSVLRSVVLSSAFNRSTTTVE